MKKYLLFSGFSYYPSGGFEDYQGCFETLESALEACAKISSMDWFHIVDMETLAIIKEGKRQ